MRRAVVTGAGGFIGHHLVAHLKGKGLWVRGVDIREPEFEETAADEFLLRDLRVEGSAREAVSGVDDVYHLAADMGGIGYITGTRAPIARNNTLMNLHTLDAAADEGVDRFLFSSSACVYPQHLQEDPDVDPLREEDAWPADPEPGYGLEKLYTEKLCEYYGEDFGLETRVLRFHNVYGPNGAWEGGKEKAPAALCRKVAEAEDGGPVVVWGDGRQTRSFMHVDDCVEGIHRLMQSGYAEPLNLGTDRLVTIDELVDVIAEAAGKEIHPEYDTSKPQGVRGRNSDNSRLREVLAWEPEVSLEEGIAGTYAWIWEQLDERGRAAGPRPGARRALAG